MISSKNPLTHLPAGNHYWFKCSTFVKSNEIIMTKKRKQPRKKAPRLGRKTLEAAIYSFFAENPFSTYNHKQIAHVIGARDVAAKNLVK